MYDELQVFGAHREKSRVQSHELQVVQARILLGLYGFLGRARYVFMLAEPYDNYGLG